MSPLVERDGPPEGYSPIGRVGRAFGLMGGFHFRPSDPGFAEAVAVGAELFVERLGIVTVQEIRPRGSSLILFVDRVRTLDRARALVGGLVYGPDATFVDAETLSLVGVEVEYEGVVLGEVVEITGVAGAEVLEVRTNDRGTVLLPLHAPYLREEEDRLVLEDPPAGLLDPPA